MKTLKIIYNKKFKGLNININDNKQLIGLFNGKYQQFLFRNKGTEINNKQDIINILNKKPRSFLTTLNILVKTFKQYENRLISYTSQIHPTKMVSVSKSTPAGFNLNKATTAAKAKVTRSAAALWLARQGQPGDQLAGHGLESEGPAQLQHAGAPGAELINNKIKLLQKSLINNKLAIPLNLLTPLLDGRATPIDRATLARPSASGLSSQGKNAGLSEPVEYGEIPQIDLSDILGPDWALAKDQDLSGYKTLYKPTVDKIKDIIKENNENNILTGRVASNLKYIKLITSAGYGQIAKFEQNFQQYIQFKFNTCDPAINRGPARKQNIQTLLEYAFRSMSCLISKPVFMETPDKLIINLFYYIVPSRVRINKGGPKQRVALASRGVPLATSLNGINL